MCCIVCGCTAQQPAGGGGKANLDPLNVMVRES